MRFSGHETFAVRHAWLPKAFHYLSDPHSPGFADEEAAMVALGLGKNMVRALRFWVEVLGLATPDLSGTLRPSNLARVIFGEEGLDPYLEDPRTLWVLHWHLSTRKKDPLCAWDVLVNRWPKAEFTKSEALKEFQRESEKHVRGGHSPVTLGQHFDIFIHMYVSGRGGAGNVEETLDSPFADLELVTQIGERKGREGRAEPVYAFRRGEKPEITPGLFAYVIDQVFSGQGQKEATRTFRNLVVGPNGPGRVFQLPEDAVRDRLDHLAHADATYRFQLSTVQALLQRSAPPSSPEQDEARATALLRLAYGLETSR